MYSLSYFQNQITIPLLHFPASWTSLGVCKRTSYPKNARQKSNKSIEITLNKENINEILRHIGLEDVKTIKPSDLLEPLTSSPLSSSSLSSSPSLSSSLLSSSSPSLSSSPSSSPSFDAKLWTKKELLNTIMLGHQIGPGPVMIKHDQSPSSTCKQYLQAGPGERVNINFNGRGRNHLGNLLVRMQKSILHNQLRTFKTRRSDKLAEESTTNNLFSGIKSAFDKVSSHQSGPQSTEKLKVILGDLGSNVQAQDKVKIAFAEGYMANTKKEPQAPGSVWMRRLGKLFWYGLLCWVVLQLLQLYSPFGGNVKISVLKGDRFEINPEEISVTFDDVKGMEEAKQELKDIVEFLREPEKFKVLGAKLPKGVLLVGPPGIGKSLLARAVAGESGVPFFHASGSEFDEIFVGTGAKRVRQLFDAAKARAPCIVFIDEIDSVGAKRTSSQIHPYANQTINQLLSEMDGFQQNEGIIVLGATNRRDNLDKAILRPGRFDVEVRVFPPDLKGRIEILEHYMSKVKRGIDVSVEKLARSTTGCTGADLENLVNQAALKAAMDGDPYVVMSHLEFARDKVLMGPAKKTKIPDEATNLLTAHHEAGHTLVAYYTKDATPLNKVTIIPRGTSLGHTSFIPDKEQYNLTRSQLLAQLDVAMGGRVGEELVYGADNVTTGAQADFSHATAIATAMVKQYGMSEKVGVRVFHEDDVDTGLSFVKLNEVGPATTELVDNEIKRLLQESYERARAVVKSHLTEHKNLAQALMKHEILDAEEVKSIIEGRPIQPKPSPSKLKTNISSSHIPVKISV